MVEIKDADAYQKLAGRTLIAEPDGEYSDTEILTAWHTLTLAGQTGSLAELVKKGVFHRHGLDLQALRTAVVDIETGAATFYLPETLTDYSGKDLMMVWNTLGLVGEAGEVAALVESVVFERNDLNRDKLIKELGDVLWYVAALCTKLDIPLSEVMLRNVTKLLERYPNGYSSEASKQRVDTASEVRPC